MNRGDLCQPQSGKILLVWILVIGWDSEILLPWWREETIRTESDRSHYHLNQLRCLRNAYQRYFFINSVSNSMTEQTKLCFLALTTGPWSPWWFTLYGWPLGIMFALKIKLLLFFFFVKGSRFHFLKAAAVCWTCFKTRRCSIRPEKIAGDMFQPGTTLTLLRV